MLLKISLVCLVHFKCSGQATLLFPHVYLRNFVIGGGKVNVIGLPFQGEVLGKLVFLQQFKYPIAKQGSRDDLENCGIINVSISC